MRKNLGWEKEEHGREEGGKGKRKGRGGDTDEDGLDAVKCLAVACIAVALRHTALLAGRSCSHVRARERLQLVQLLRQFAQHTGAEIGAALG